MADGQRMDRRLSVASHPQEPGALRSADPLVQAAGVEAGAELGDRERHLPGRMRAVDQGLHSTGGELGHELAHRQDQRGRRRDVVHDRESGARRDAAQEGIGHLLGRAQGEGD